ncbi:unnamed protein product [Lepeophtheirus salmonis]|uniref:(salmon louse) hypothetical protein n=1 Tax=Lepeophtheirus salmonis TaxID=72036 RepID=A0A7R8CV75_LEPSM|nr:unnamed protein product [Lepeophtheirus salmonis]CAF2942644.1 unnamed protein product [Lepeophtheirus salmonis]
MQNGSSLPEIHHPIFTRSEYQKLLKKTTKRCPCVYSDLTGKNRAWIGLVQNEDTATAGDTKSCSASIISPTFLITSASCMCNLMKGFCPLKSTDGPMGNFYSKDPTKLSVIIPTYSEDKKLTIEKLYIHKNFKTSNFQDDVGLLKLKKDDDFSKDSNHKSICFPTPDMFKAKKVVSANCKIKTGKLDCERDDLNYHYTGIQRVPLEKTCATNGLGMKPFAACLFDKGSEKCQDGDPMKKIKKVNSTCDINKNSVKDANTIKDKFIVNYDDGAVCPDPKFDIKKKYEKYPDVQSLDKWCYTCSSGLPNNCEDWGYCSRNCEFLSELNTPKYPIVEGIANTVQNKDNCGDEKKNICVMDILFEGNSITMKEDDNHKYVEDSSTSFGQMKIFEDIKKNMKSYSNHNCKDLSGGAVWTILSVGRGKKYKAPFLTGLLGNITSECNGKDGSLQDIKNVDIESYAKDVIDVVKDLCTLSLKKKKKKKL